MSNINVELWSGFVLVFFLIIALYMDITKHKIPNKLVFSILITGLIIQLQTAGFVGLAYSLLGVLIGFFLFMPFNLLGGMRAGDLKLMAAIGAFLALDTTLAAGLSLLAGACYGIAVLFWRRGVDEYYYRYSAMLLECASTGKLRYQAPAMDAAAATSFPYATAIATGTLLTLLFFH